MSRIIRVLSDGSLISSGPSPANVKQGVVAYSQNPADTEKVSIDWLGYLNGETITTPTWAGSGLTVGTTTNSGGITTALISTVPETGAGTVDLTIVTSGGRTKKLTMRFYGFQVATE
jgi:hypothetical protein